MREILNFGPSELRQVWPLINLKRYQEDVCSELVNIENLSYGQSNTILEIYQVESIIQIMDKIVKSKCLLPNALSIYEPRLRNMAKINSRIYDLNEEKYHNLGKSVIYATVKNSFATNVNNLELRADTARFYDSISRKLLKYGQDTVFGVKEYMYHHEKVFDKPLPLLPAKNELAITKRKSMSELSNSSSQLSLHRFESSSIFSENSGKVGEDDEQRTLSSENNKRSLGEPDLFPLVKTCLHYSSIMEESFDLNEVKVEKSIEIEDIPLDQKIDNPTDNKLENKIENKIEIENITANEIEIEDTIENETHSKIHNDDIEIDCERVQDAVQVLEQVNLLDEDDDEDDDDCFHLLNSFAEVGPAPKISYKSNFFKSNKAHTVTSRKQNLQPTSSVGSRLSRIYTYKQG